MAVTIKLDNKFQFIFKDSVDFLKGGLSALSKELSIENNNNKDKDLYYIYNKLFDKYGLYKDFNKHKKLLFEKGYYPY